MTSYLYPYIQESINLNSKNTDNYIVTIQYYLDGLSFVVFDAAAQKFVALKHYQLSEKGLSLKTLLLELQEKESWKLEDFKNVNILIDNNINTFVPKDYFQEDIKEDAFIKIIDSYFFNGLIPCSNNIQGKLFLCNFSKNNIYLQKR
mgnify:CR=1 FL=1